ncbi:PAS domain-containing protein [Chryseobacterium chendengshani]|uniref:PAS domain-containing protein n=1 Tax=Chryseobacterium sp. LJ756 TaxID=2864113 RepID=UPI001C642DA1|nr:PAS domain-containing protein [Chryseobacterium sp. LJ756]MBW7675661.1 PAS domain-containing protein [Chryseobacterium sp. LJ756]
MKFTDTPLLSTIIESSPFGICIVNTDLLTVEMLNNRYVEIYGESTEFLLGESVDYLIAKGHHLDKKIVSDVILYKKTIKTAPVNLNFVPLKGQQEAQISTIYSPVLNDEGEITKVAIWIVENDFASGDVHNGNVEAAIELENEHANSLLKEIPSAFATLSGKELIFEFINSTYQNLVPGRELVGQPFLEALPELVGSDLERSLKQVYNDGIALNFSEDLVPLSKTGLDALEQRYFTYRLIPRFNSEKKVDGIFIFTSEVTHAVDNKVNLERTSNNLNQIINMLPASVVIIRYDNLIVEMINDANLAYWKKTRDEVIGKPFLEILPDLADQPFAGQLRRVMETGEIIDVKESPVLFTESDGTVRETFVDYTYQPLTGLDGKRDGVLVMSFEITDRVLAQRQLEQSANMISQANDQLSILINKLSKSESRFKLVFQKAPVAIGLLRGQDFIIESANKKILEVWGKTENIIGLTLADALPEIKDQPFLGFLDKVYATGKPFYANEIKAMLMHDDELKELFFNVVYQPIGDTEGNIADILVVAADVTEQVKARLMVEKSEAYFKMLADLVPAKISNALPTGEVTFFNKRWLEFAGMGFADLRDFGYLQMMHPDEISKFQKGLADASSSKTAYVSEMRFKNTDGEYIWHLNIASPIFDEQGNLTMWIGSTTDIQWLKEEEQRKNDFIGMVSHELKTPLTSVNTYLQLLLRKAEKTDDEFLKRAYIQSLKQIKHMTDMINGFLDVSRLESAKLQIEKSEFDFSELIEEVCIDYKLLYSTHHFIFLPAESISVNADRLKIAQVMNNLVGNAVKYSENGTDVTISYETFEDRIRVIVKDQGMGIKVENLKKLFEQYYRVRNNSQIAGFGIGLYLSAEIVKAHGGTMWATSEFGKGSVLYFELPLL